MKTKLDWPNHIIAFFSALLGILIAFQLEGYRDTRKDNEELKSALISIKSEIDNNFNIYETNVEQLGIWLEYWEIIKDIEESGLITIEKDKYEKLNVKTPNRFRGWNIIEELNDSMIIIQTNLDIVVDVLPETGISVSSWNASLYSGVINKLDNDILVKLTHIYEWIEKDLGVSDRELLEDTMNEGFDNINVVVAYITKVKKVHKLKLENAQKIYAEIEWK